MDLIDRGCRGGAREFAEAQVDGNARHAAYRDTGDQPHGVAVRMSREGTHHLILSFKSLGKAPHSIPLIELKPVFRLDDLERRMMHE